MGNSLRILVAAGASFAAGVIGFFFVDPHGSWYTALREPPLMPPDWVFALAWIALYPLMALALMIVWTKKPQDSETSGWVRFYFVQLLFNVGWTIFFFGLQTPFIAFIDMLFLGFTILCLFTAGEEIYRRVVYLLAPYLAWIGFAAYLNFGIWYIN